MRERGRKGRREVELGERERERNEDCVWGSVCVCVCLCVYKLCSLSEQKNLSSACLYCYSTNKNAVEELTFRFPL